MVYIEPKVIDFNLKYCIL